MSPRVIHIPLSGGYRKVLAKEIRAAHNLCDSLRAQADQKRALARARYDEASAIERDAWALECQAWSTIMWAGGPAQPSPTIGQAVGCGIDQLECQCSRCNRISFLDLKTVRRQPKTELWRLEPALGCEICRKALRYKPRAHIIGLKRSEPPSSPAGRRA